MPMRGELSIPAMRPVGAPATDQDAWAVIGCCLIALLISMYFIVSSTPSDQIPLLIVLSNFGRGLNGID